MPGDALFKYHTSSVVTPTTRVSKASNGMRGKLKAQKSRTIGVPNAKMGAPSVLSESDRRKLVRLYVYTNIKLSDICTILSLNHKEVKPRTVHHILRKLLQEGYNLLRPKGTATRKLRVSQVKQLSKVPLDRRVKRRKAKPSVTRSPCSELHVPRTREETTCSSPKEDITTDCDGKEALWLQELNDYADWIQENAPWTTLCDLGTSSSICKSETMFDPKINNDEERSIKIPAAQPVLASSTGETASINDTHTSPIPKSKGGYFEGTEGGPDQTWIESSDQPSRHHICNSTTNEMETPRLNMTEGTNYNLENPAPPGAHETLPPRTCSCQSSASFSLASVQSHESKKRSRNEIVSEAENILALNQPSRKREVSLLRASEVMSETEGTSADGEESTCSDLSRAISRFSAYSSSQKRDIKDMITKFSVAAISESDETTSGPLHPSDGHHRTTDDHLNRSMISVNDSSWTIGTQFDLFDNHEFETYRPWQEDALESMRSPLLTLTTFLPDWRIVRFPEGGCSEFRIPKNKMGSQELLAELHVGGRLDWKDQCGNTVLHYAAALGVDCNTLSTLIERVSRVNDVNTAGQTFMHVVSLSRVSGVNAIKGQLDRHSFNYQHSDHEGQTVTHALAHPLIWAPIWNQINAKRDASGYLIDGNYPFASFGQPVHKIIDPADLASSVRKIFESYGALREDGGSKTTLYNVIDSYHASGDQLIPCYVLGFIECDPCFTHTRNCLSSLRNSRIEDERGRNALHILADPSWNPRERGWVSCNELARKFLVDSLLRNGADVNAYDKSGETPLMKYATALHLNDAHMEWLFEVLISYGAEVNQRNRKRQSPLHMAVQGGNIVATRVLLRHGANVHARDQWGYGVIKQAESRQRQKKDDGSLYAKIAACMALAIDAGAIHEPSEALEWTLPEFRSLVGL